MKIKTKGRSSSRLSSATTTTSTATTISSIAADLEDAMLYTCLSHEKTAEVDLSLEADDDGIIISPPFISDKNYRSAGRSSTKPKKTLIGERPNTTGSMKPEKKHIALSLSGSFATLDDSSTASQSSSDSDISLCRSERPTSRRQTKSRFNSRDTNKNNVSLSSEEDENDADCTNTISAVSSVASLFFGNDAPCSLHLEGATSVGTISEPKTHKSKHSESILNNRQNVRQKNTPLAPSQQQVSLLKKSSLKPPSGTTTTVLTNSTNTKNNTQGHHEPPGQSASSSPKNVQFAQVNVREYNVSISQNPSCSGGAPIELGWSFREPPPVCLDNYEEERQPRRRRLQELLLGDSVRRRMLLQKYTQQEITDAIRQVEHLKRQRVMTYMMLPASALDEAAEELYDYMAQIFK